MKHILLATTALVATAGFASAEVSGTGPGTINITGWAEMGIIGGDFDGTEITTQFHTDIDVSFSMTGTADNGLTFGGTVDLDENGAFGNTTQGGETIFVSAGAATLTMGDTDGAYDFAMREVNLGGGSINDDETAHAGFSGNGGFGLPAPVHFQIGTGLDGLFDGQIARFDYSFEGFTGSLSAEIDDTGTFDPIWGLGVRYAGEAAGINYGVGLGYQTLNDFGDVIGLSLDAGFSNGLSAAINHSIHNFDAFDPELTHTAIGIGYNMNALSVGVNWGHYVFDDDVLTSGLGLSLGYDFGGGIVAKAGYGASDIEALDVTANTFSLGLAMSF